MYWTLLAVVSWGLWAIFSKVIGDVVSAAQNQAISTLGLLPILAVLAWFDEPGTLRMPSANVRRGIFLAVIAGILSCLGNIPYYGVLGSGAQAATVVPLTALYPLVTVLLAVPLLKERLTRVQSLGIVVSLAAIYLLNVQSEEGLVSAWLLGALVSILLWGTSGFLQKLSTNHVSGFRAAFWFLAAFVPVALVLVVQDPLPSAIAVRTWILCGLQGFLLAFGNLAVLVAFAQGGKASVIIPLTALYPLVSIPLAVLAFGERVGWRGCTGVVLAVAAVAMLSYEAPPKNSESPDPQTEVAL
jgi:transporter family protein